MGDAGGGHSSLFSSVIDNFGNVEVHGTNMGLNGNLITNQFGGYWKLNDMVYAWHGGNSTFVNLGTFQVVGPINYWYFNVKNFGATEIGGTFPITNYIGLVIFKDYDQGLPGFATPGVYTRIPYGGSLGVGQLLEQTFSVYDGLLILDGTIRGSVATAPGTTFVAGTLDFTTGTFGVGNANIESGLGHTLTIGGTLWITVDNSATGAPIASRLGALGVNVTLLPTSTLQIHNNGATPGDGWYQDIITAQTVTGEFGGLFFSGLTFWVDANGVPHTWFVLKQSAPFLTQYFLTVVSPVNPVPGLNLPGGPLVPVGPGGPLIPGGPLVPGGPFPILFVPVFPLLP
jgi:hypothetical protein